MDFVGRFEDHQVERIRRAILAYRSKHAMGDVTLAKKILKHSPKSGTYESTLKNLQRLRKGERMRGAPFLNACVQFLEVEMATPPEEELGLAMKHFVGNASGYADLWKDVAGDYVLRVLGERPIRIPEVIWQERIPVTGIPARPTIAQSQSQDSLAVLSIGPGEGMDYGVARERFFFRDDKGSTDEDAGLSNMNMLNRTGVCLPVGRQDMLVMIRDFQFSHMYVLRREKLGFAGTMIIPSACDFLSAEVPLGMSQSQYDIVLRRGLGSSRA